MQKTIAIIPARGGSKRFPGKNTCNFSGLPLLAHSIRYALDNREIISEVYVSTDNSEIKKVAIQYGAKTIDRPAGLSEDKSPTVAAIQHALEVIPEKPDNIILLQPTNPLRPKSLLSKCSEEFLNSNSNSLMTVSPIIEKIGKINNGAFKPVNYRIGQRSQELESYFFENGLLYISKSELIQQGKIFGEDGIPYITDHPYSKVDIDTEQDLIYAEWINKNFLNES